MEINIIVAYSNTGAIGKDNKLLWKLKDDMKFFKEMTTGNTVIMGRKTYESIGKALPNRTNIVITRQNNYLADNCIVVNSLDEAIRKVYRNQKVFIIGGGEIYRQGLEIADKVYATQVDCDLEGDTYFETLSDDFRWKEMKEFKKNDDNEYNFEIVTYERI
jgi:dihydrofolate reductase